MIPFDHRLVDFIVLNIPKMTSAEVIRGLKRATTIVWEDGNKCVAYDDNYVYFIVLKDRIGKNIQFIINHADNLVGKRAHTHSEQILKMFSNGEILSIDDKGRYEFMVSISDKIKNKLKGWSVRV